MTYQPYIDAVIEQEKDHSGAICTATVQQARDEAVMLDRAGHRLGLALEVFLSEVRECDYAFNDNPAKPTKEELMDALLDLMDMKPEAARLIAGVA